MPHPQLDQQIAKRLSDNHVRYTRGRRSVVAGLVNGEGPMTVAEIQDSMAVSVPLSSLYRTLAVMSESGVVSTHHSGQGQTRYELAEWLTGHHHHLVCTNCGAVDDIEIGVEHERQLEMLVIALAGGANFDVTDHSLEIDGLCRRCKQ